jgi:hypothetical protein
MSWPVLKNWPAFFAKIFVSLLLVKYITGNFGCLLKPALNI